jgi:multiple sugar transport system permease protein
MFLSKQATADQAIEASLGASQDRWRDDMPYLAALAPAAVILTLFFVFPALWALYTSMTSLSLLDFAGGGAHWVGLDNYRRLLDDPDFTKVVKNTAVFVFGSAVIGQTLGGLLLALLLDHAQTKRYRLGHLAYAAILLAWISPPVLAGFIWGGIYDYDDGTLNQALSLVGLGPVDVLGKTPMLGVIVADAWRGVAFGMLICLGALQMIPPSIHEAARVDGAGVWARFRDHTLPGISHALALVLIMTTIVTMGSFVLILIMTNGDPGKQTETLGLYAFHWAYGNLEIAYGSAISTVMLGVNLVLAAIYLRIVRVR